MEKRKKKELSKRNKDAIENYMNTIKQKYDKRNTLKNHKYTISRMLTVIDSDYDKIKSDDILGRARKRSCGSAWDVNFLKENYFNQRIIKVDCNTF